MTRIDCSTARDCMLVADLSELQSGDEPLALHLQQCSVCSLYARHILAGYRTLDAGLTELTRKQRRATRRRWPWVIMPLSLAAAAVVALIIAPSAERTPVEPTRLVALMFPERPVASPPPGKQAMVFDDDNVIVVWLY